MSLRNGAHIIINDADCYFLDALIGSGAQVPEAMLSTDQPGLYREERQVLLGDKSAS